MHMTELWKKIYNNVLVYEKDVIANNKLVDEEVAALVMQYKEKLSADELEELKNLLSSVVLIAEQTSFETGVRYGMRMMHSVLVE